MHPLAMVLEGVSVKEGLGTEGTQHLSTQMGLAHIGADGCL